MLPHMTEIDRSKARLSPEEAAYVFADPVAYLAELGIDSSLVGQSLADLPDAA